MAIDRLMRLADVEDRVGIRRSAIYRWMNDGRFPKPLRVGPRAVRWRESVVQEWIDGLQTTKKGE